MGDEGERLNGTKARKSTIASTIVTVMKLNRLAISILSESLWIILTPSPEDKVQYWPVRSYARAISSRNTLLTKKMPF
jgi:hypothetical protein